MKKKIAKLSKDPSRPYLNLEPLIELLAKSGNPAVADGFVMERDGWICQLAKPIDFELLISNFEIPSSIVLSPEHQSILDQNSWVEIVGGNKTNGQQSRPISSHEI